MHSLQKREFLQLQLRTSWEAVTWPTSSLVLSSSSTKNNLSLPQLEMKLPEAQSVRSFFYGTPYFLILAKIENSQPKKLLDDCRIFMGKIMYLSRKTIMPKQTLFVFARISELT
jgi:hypothetical protein